MDVAVPVNAHTVQYYPRFLQLYFRFRSTGTSGSNDAAVPTTPEGIAALVLSTIR